MAHGSYITELEHKSSNISNAGITLGYQGSGLIITDNEYPSCLAEAAGELKLAEALCEYDKAVAIQNPPVSE